MILRRAIILAAVLAVMASAPAAWADDDDKPEGA